MPYFKGKSVIKVLKVIIRRWRGKPNEWRKEQCAKLLLKCSWLKPTINTFSKCHGGVSL